MMEENVLSLFETGGEDELVPKSKSAFTLPRKQSNQFTSNPAIDEDGQNITLC